MDGHIIIIDDDDPNHRVRSTLITKLPDDDTTYDNVNNYIKS
jgi:hypothetical protein